MIKLKERHSLFLNGSEFPLDGSKLILGSSESCDIKIIDESKTISDYHCLIFIKEDCIEVLDLESTNSTYINGQKIEGKTPLFTGDTLSLGEAHAQLSHCSQEFNFKKHDKDVITSNSHKEEKLYIPRQISETEVLIDDEYCDILFEDIPLYKHELSIQSLKIDNHSYIETELLEEEFELKQKNSGKCIQITTAINGSIIEQYYHPIVDGTIHATPMKKDGHIQLELISKKTPLVKTMNGEISLCDIDGFTTLEEKMSTSENKTLIMANGAVQVFVEVANAPDTLIQLSSFGRDKFFFKDTFKKFAGVIAPMLLLLLVDFTPEKKEPLKKLSIIYKKPTKANVNEKKMASTNPNDTKKDTGHKQTKQPDKKISHSKAGKKAKPKKVVKKKVAKAQKPAAKKVSKTKAKMKAYSFKMASNVSSVFSNSKSVSVVKNNTKNTIKTASSQSGSLSTKVTGTSSNNIGNMGSDSAGRSLASFGSKGLSSKSGRDTAYIQTQTVVLGSMDPDLLRKILQQYLPQFRHCYQQELVYNSEDIKGIVDLNFEITGSGKVSKVNIRAKDSRFSKKGTNCMAKVLAVIDFPKPKGGGRVAVRQPLSFFSEQEKG